jgi:hypothetical protein
MEPRMITTTKLIKETKCVHVLDNKQWGHYTCLKCRMIFYDEASYLKIQSENVDIKKLNHKLNQTQMYIKKRFKHFEFEPIRKQEYIYEN